jgi:hypothetical protein
MKNIYVFEMLLKKNGLPQVLCRSLEGEVAGEFFFVFSCGIKDRELKVSGVVSLEFEFVFSFVCGLAR